MFFTEVSLLFKQWITHFWIKLWMEAERQRESEVCVCVRTTIQAVHSVLEGGLGLKIAAASPAVHLPCVKRWLFMQRAAPAVSLWGLVWLDGCQTLLGCLLAHLPAAPPGWTHLLTPPLLLRVCPTDGSHALFHRTYCVGLISPSGAERSHGN